MKKYLILISITALLLIAVIGLLPMLTKHGLINLNKLTIHTDEPLAIDKVKVIEGFFSINRHDDSELFYDWNDGQIVFDGVNNILTTNRAR
ncbi:MAG: hypothetical protein QM734_15145 [Cyclobacteriaceae bacterium]